MAKERALKTVILNHCGPDGSVTLDFTPEPPTRCYEKEVTRAVRRATEAGFLLKPGRTEIITQDSDIKN